MNGAPQGATEPLHIQRRDALIVLSCLGITAFNFLKVLPSHARGRPLLIDRFDNEVHSMLGTRWRGVSDQVMGGRSEVLLVREMVEGRRALRLSGDVSLENNGGFIQAALDLAPNGKTIDASAYSGVRMVVRGNGEQYSVHLRTPDNIRPWQSYRAQFQAGSEWQTIDLPFKSFVPYRLRSALDTSRLRRLAVVAIGREFRADVAVAEVAFYR